MNIYNDVMNNRKDCLFSKLTKSGLFKMNDEETSKYIDDYFSGNKRYHLVTFGTQICGFTMDGGFVHNSEEVYNAMPDILQKAIHSNEIISVYPKLNMSIYPFRVNPNSDSRYQNVMDNLDKHFKDLLELNDKHYKTDTLILSFTDLTDEKEMEVLINKFSDLLEASKYLKQIIYQIA